ncbi:sulfatase [bacterium]|nr:sulfatase [bacterium]
MWTARTLGAALGAAAFAATLVSCAGEPRGPNVLVISVDTLRHDFLGAYGAPQGGTPTLDRLAAEGVLYENAVSTSSWTLPAHMSLFTGQYPASHGVNRDGRALVEGKRTLAGFLSGHGYRTGGFVAGPYLHRAYGFDRGFDEYVHCVRWGVKLRDDGLVKNVIGANLRSHQGVTSPKTDAQATEWLDTVPRGRPWFLFAHYWDPHYDFTPPAPYDRYLDPDYDGRLTGHDFLQDDRIAADMPPAERKRLLDLYRGEIRFTDRWIGRLLAHIEERGELENTLIVVVGDHGEEFFEHGNKGHRHNLHAETLRIPMLVRLPGVMGPGRVIADPVSLVDVFPTVAGAIGAAPPERRMGVSLADDAATAARAGVVAELFGRYVAWRSRSGKLILDVERRESELYDVRTDPGEQRDRAASEPELRNALERALAESGYARYAPHNVAEAKVDAATVEALRALGYTD